MEDYLSETIETYENNAEAYRDSRAHYKMSIFMDPFLDLIQGKRILDIGCGPGRDSNVFVDKGCDVTGIDITQAFIEMAQQAVPEAEFYNMDIRQLQFEDNIFNGAWASAILLHLKPEDFQQALQEIYRVLAPEGILFFSVKEGSGTDVSTSETLGGGMRFFQYYTVDEVRGMIEQTPFKVISLEASNEKGLYGNDKRDITFISGFLRK